jgi:O-antigen ligase
MTEKTGTSGLTAEVLGSSHLSLRLSAIWYDFWAAPWSFKLTCLYVFIEYVRPHQIYPWLAGPRWALISILAATLAYVVEGPRVRSRTLINTLLVLFSGVLLASSVMAEYRTDSFDRLSIYLNWLLAFFLIANTATTERRFLVFIVLFLLWSTKMSQHGFRTWAERGFSFAGYGLAGAPGWFSNSGEFALQMAVFFPLSLYFLIAFYRSVSKAKLIILLLLPLTAAGSIAASSSRGGQLALAAIGLWIIARSQRRFRALAVLSVVAPLIWLAIPPEQKQRFEESGTDKTSVLRIKYWKAGIEMANDHPMVGIGYENWRSYYLQNYFDPNDSLSSIDYRGRPIIETSHNSFVEVGSQLGYLGLAGFLVLLTSVWVVNAQSRRMLSALGERGDFLRNMSYGLDGGMIAFIVGGFFMAVAFYPFVWFQLAMSGALRVAALDLSRRIGKSIPAPSPRGTQRRVAAGRRVFARKAVLRVGSRTA